MDAVDAVVIGSGAGGAPVALQLARAGMKVAVLERGPRYDRKRFVHDEIRIGRRDFFVPSIETDPHVIVADGKPPEATTDGWIASCVGGGTVHMSGFFYRFHPEDFRIKSFLGASPASIDWPVTYEELDPYYELAERELGCSGPASEGPFAPPRKTPWPLPALQAHPASALIDQGCKKLGWTAFDTPRAITSRAYEGRNPCVYCQLCGGFGCETGAKSSTLESIIPKAEATGRCTVVPDAMVRHIHVDDAGRAKSVLYVDAGGKEHNLETKLVVVACSAVESARLFLLSVSHRFPNGLANDEGQVGQGLVFSTLAKAFGRFRYQGDAEKTRLLKDSAPFLGRSVLDHYLPREAGAPKKAGALNFLFPSGGPIHQAEEASRRQGGFVWGKELNHRLQQIFHEERVLVCETFGEYLPTAGTRVELDPEVKDRFGLPVARMVIERHPHDGEVSRYLGGKAKAALDAAGADEAWIEGVGGRTMHLPMGALRMSRDPKKGATNEDGRAHGTKNVFVSDGAALCSSGGVPPTLTIVANAFRIGDRIAEAAGRGDL